MSDLRVVATVLNWANPFGTLEVLRCLSAQTRAPDAVVVVDNGSPEPLDLADSAMEPVDLLRTEQNLGVGGGHNIAIIRAIDIHQADLVWILEHDTFPDASCLEELLAAQAAAPIDSVIATELTRNNYERTWIDDGADGHRLTQVTLNGPLIPRTVIDRVGLLREDLFVGQEDWEYSERLSEAEVTVIRAPRAVAVHANKGMGRFDGYVSPTRLYYSARNLVALNQRNTLVPAARLLLAAGVELIRPDRGFVYASARYWAAVDGIRGRLGRRDHRFMRR